MKRRSLLVSYQTIVIREVTRFTRVWLRTLIPPAVTTGLYFIIFGTLMGERIGSMDGLPYSDFMMPGLLMLSVVLCSYTNVASSVFSSRFQHYLDEILVAPIPDFVVISGFITGGVIRGMMIAVIVLATSAMFVDISAWSWLLVIFTLFLSSVLFSAAGLVNALFAKNFDDISIIPTLILTPLIYLGGVFYPVSMLPEKWQAVSALNPLFYVINATRAGFSGHCDTNIAFAFGVTLVSAAAMFLLALWLFHRGTGVKS
ncbi:MAG: ABC transporter permease [Succinivibrionaceae bacterium]|jgi:ABC-2 type transport system permease protein|nr:ABC transporter permease [Pseudomonadota bacterium]MDD6547264.1 ABC transporter permease [Pseudomonadota bacterium]MDY3143818.1 ABC transporter permease [Succinivibrionaceae bacterium]